jgi:hypothetical protein
MNHACQEMLIYCHLLDLYYYPLYFSKTAFLNFDSHSLATVYDQPIPCFNLQLLRFLFSFNLFPSLSVLNHLTTVFLIVLSKMLSVITIAQSY